MDKTEIYYLNEFEDVLINKTLKEVSEVLEDMGYNPINQLVGYLISGDESYITSANGARSKIKEFDRNKILLTLLNGYLKK